MTSEVSFIRNFRANHLGSNFRPGAEAQSIHHAVQTRRQRLVLQFQRPCPQLRPLHPFLQGVDIGLLSIDPTEELVLFFIDIRVPRMVAICHGLGIRFNLGQVFFHLALLALQPVSLEANHTSVQSRERRVEAYPSPLPCKQTPEPPNQHGRIPHRLSRAVPRLVNDVHINNTPAQQCPHHHIIGTLFGAPKRFKNAIHYQGLMPELIIKRCPCYPMVIPIITHQRKVHPL